MEVRWPFCGRCRPRRLPSPDSLQTVGRWLRRSLSGTCDVRWPSNCQNPSQRFWTTSATNACSGDCLRRFLCALETGGARAGDFGARVVPNSLRRPRRFAAGITRVSPRGTARISRSAAAEGRRGIRRRLLTRNNRSNPRRCRRSKTSIAAVTGRHPPRHGPVHR